MAESLSTNEIELGIKRLINFGNDSSKHQTQNFHHSPGNPSVPQSQQSEKPESDGERAFTRKNKNRNRKKKNKLSKLKSDDESRKDTPPSDEQNSNNQVVYDSNCKKSIETGESGTDVEPNGLQTHVFENKYKKYHRKTGSKQKGAENSNTEANIDYHRSESIGSNNSYHQHESIGSNSSFDQHESVGSNASSQSIHVQRSLSDDLKDGKIVDGQRRDLEKYENSENANEFGIEGNFVLCELNNSSKYPDRRNNYGRSGSQNNASGGGGGGARQNNASGGGGGGGERQNNASGGGGGARQNNAIGGGGGGGARQNSASGREGGTRQNNASGGGGGARQKSASKKDRNAQNKKQSQDNPPNGVKQNKGENRDRQGQQRHSNPEFGIYQHPNSRLRSSSGVKQSERSKARPDSKDENVHMEHGEREKAENTRQTKETSPLDAVQTTGPTTENLPVNAVQKFWDLPVKKKGKKKKNKESKSADTEEIKAVIVQNKTKDDAIKELERDMIFPLKKKSTRFVNAKFFCRLCEYHMDEVEDCRKHMKDARHARRNEVRKIQAKLKKMPSPSVQQIQALDEVISDIVLQYGLNDGDLQYRKQVVTDLQTYLHPHIPGISLCLYGSSLTGIGLKDSDVNIDLVVPEKISAAKGLTQVFKLLRETDKFEDVRSDFSAKIPSIYFVVPNTEIKCQLTINSVLAHKTSQLISIYASTDPRVLQLAIALKYWARICKVDRQEEGTLPSYCLGLMVLCYLQQCKPPVLPVLMAYEGDTSATNNKKKQTILQVDFDQLRETADKWKSENTDTAGGLWLGLLKFYSLTFDCSTHVISVRTRALLTRAERKWNSKRIAIEDPFSNKRNASRCVTSFIVFEYIWDCVRKAYYYFGLPTNFEKLTTEEKRKLKMEKHKNQNDNEDSEKEKTQEVTIDDCEEDSGNDCEEDLGKECGEDLGNENGDDHANKYLDIHEKIEDFSKSDEKSFNDTIDRGNVDESESDSETEGLDIAPPCEDDEDSEVIKDSTTDMSILDVTGFSEKDEGNTEVKDDGIHCSSVLDKIKACENDTGSSNSIIEKDLQLQDLEVEDTVTSDGQIIKDIDQSVKLDIQTFAAHIVSQAVAKALKLISLSHNSSAAISLDCEKNETNPNIDDQNNTGQLAETANSNCPSVTKSDTCMDGECDVTLEDINKSDEHSDQLDKDFVRCTQSLDSEKSDAGNKTEDSIVCSGVVSVSNLHQIGQVSQTEVTGQSDKVQNVCTNDMSGDQAARGQGSTVIPELQYQYNFSEENLTDGKGPAIICCICDKEGHLKYNCPEENLPDLEPLPPMTKAHLQTMTNLLKQVPRDFGFSEAECRERDRTRLELEDFIKELYPDARLDLFGSSYNGFGFKQSDLDLCMRFDGVENPEELEVVPIIEELTKKLKTHRGLYNVFPITTAKVPIIKFRHRRSQLEGDISLYNMLALHNTGLIRLYSTLDSRVKTLGYALKVFAKVCDIGDASRGSLSSYAYILMAIYYLQQCKPPVIPVLQELHDGPEKPELLVEGWNTWYFDNVNRLPEVWPDCGKNRMSIGELWVGLFRFYTEQFNFRDHTVCIRQLEPLTRFEKLWNGKCVAIEDPFDLNHNLGSGLSRKMNQYIIKAFIRGRELYGTPVPNIPQSYKSIADYFFDSHKLTEGLPPNDRCCRVCNKIGHIAKECPVVTNRKEREEKERKKREDRQTRQRMTEDRTRQEYPYQCEREDRQTRQRLTEDRTRQEHPHQYQRGRTVSESSNQSTEDVQQFQRQYFYHSSLRSNSVPSGYSGERQDRNIQGPNGQRSAHIPQQQYHHGNISSNQKQTLLANPPPLMSLPTPRHTLNISPVKQQMRHSHSGPVLSPHQSQQEMGQSISNQGFFQQQSQQQIRHSNSGPMLSQHQSQQQIRQSTSGQVLPPHQSQQQQQQMHPWLQQFMQNPSPHHQQPSLFSQHEMVSQHHESIPSQTNTGVSTNSVYVPIIPSSSPLSNSPLMPSPMSNSSLMSSSPVSNSSLMSPVSMLSQFGLVQPMVYQTSASQQNFGADAQRNQGRQITREHSAPAYLGNKGGNLGITVPNEFYRGPKK